MVIYKKILEKAMTFYIAGRKGDVQHIKWLFEVIPQCIKKEELDYTILMPVVLLHDIGYCKVPKGANPFNLDIRKLHSKEGAKLAQQILEELQYPEDKIVEIQRLILKHDNWAFGDNFSDEPILRAFTNFDFMWMASKEGFEIVRGFLDKTPQEFYEQIKAFQKKNEDEGRTWFNQKSKLFYLDLMTQREKELSKLAD